MKIYETPIPDFRIRFAEEQDVSLILRLINELADYENLSDEVTATEDILRDSLFVKNQAEVLIGEYKGNPVGYALFFHNFSTFLGKANIYLEDLYIQPQFRHNGFGKAMFICIAKISVERDCERLDWSCLDWNEPSIKFYKNLGAKPMSDWTVYRLDGQTLLNISHQL